MKVSKKRLTQIVKEELKEVADYDVPAKDWQSPNPLDKIEAVANKIMDNLDYDPRRPDKDKQVIDGLMHIIHLCSGIPGGEQQ